MLAGPQRYERVFPPAVRRLTAGLRAAGFFDGRGFFDDRGFFGWLRFFGSFAFLVFSAGAGGWRMASLVKGRYGQSGQQTMGHSAIRPRCQCMQSRHLAAMAARGSRPDMALSYLRCEEPWPGPGIAAR